MLSLRCLKVKDMTSRSRARYAVLEVPQGQGHDIEVKDTLCCPRGASRSRTRHAVLEAPQGQGHVLEVKNMPSRSRTRYAVLEVLQGQGHGLEVKDTPCCPRSTSRSRTWPRGQGHAMLSSKHLEVKDMALRSATLYMQTAVRFCIAISK